MIQAVDGLFCQASNYQTLAETCFQRPKHSMQAHVLFCGFCKKFDRTKKNPVFIQFQRGYFADLLHCVALHEHLDQL